MWNFKLALSSALLATTLWALPGCGGPEMTSDELGDELADLEDGKEDSASNLPKTVTVTEAKNGKTVSAKVGDTVDIRLAGNPTTGYSWKVVSQSKSLPVAGQKYIPDQPVRPGGGGTYSFLLKPDLLAAGGKHITKLAYYRSWEGVGSAIKTFSITVSVKQPKKVSCGPSSCAVGEVCCNESCGICTPPGGFCTQQACQPVCPPVVCEIACANGFEKDKNGCEICKCKPSGCQVTGCASDRECQLCKTQSGPAYVCIPRGAMC